MRILCIDDDPTFLAVYRTVLTKNLLPGDKVDTAPDAETGLAQFEQEPADLVITDLVLPKMTGIDVLREVKNRSMTTEVIVVTGQGSIDSAVEAMRLGARDYLTKPLNADVLLEKCSTIRDLLNRSKEAEDYRYAKETVEESAHLAVVGLEVRLTDYINLIDAVQAACATQELPQQKVLAITQLLANFSHGN